eukprot:4182332-Prymnesium_polylepis.1
MSSFFPAAPPPSREAGVSAAPPAGAKQQSPWEGIRVVAPNATGAEAAGQQLKFPAVRSALWDRTPQDAPTIVAAAIPRVALSPGVVAPLAMQANIGYGHVVRGASVANVRAAVSLHVYPAGRPSDASAGVVAGRAIGHRVPPLDVCAHALDHATPAGVPAQAEAGQMPVHVREWPPGGEIEPSTSEYEELLRRSEKALQGGEPLSVGEATPL